MFDQINQARRPKERGQAGFTLIELLVVIIILGVLSAVVVFAVRGVGDKGKVSAVTADEKTIRTAEEAYCAKKGTYASGDQLVAEKFLSELPTYHEVYAQSSGGSCNGWKFSILRTAAAGPYPAGRWDAVAPSGIAIPTYLERLVDGRVLAGGSNGMSAWVTKIWDPATNVWSTIDSPPDLPNEGSMALLLTDDPSTPTNECKSATVDNCGKVFLYGRYLFDPKAAPGSQWFAFPPSPMCTLCSDGSSNFKANSSFVQMKNSVGACVNSCGKVVMFINSTDLVTVFDPSNNTFTETMVPSEMQTTNSYATQLPDGRIHVCCTDKDANPKAKFFDPVSLTFTGDAALPPNGWTRRLDRQPGPVLPNGDVLFGLRTSGPAITGVYTPEAGAPGRWMSPSPPNCILEIPRACHALGSLPDGRVLSMRSNTPLQITMNETYIYNPASRTWSRSGDIGGPPDRNLDSVLLDSLSGPCGSYCGKMLVVGPISSEVYSP